MTSGNPIWLWLIPLALAAVATGHVFARRGRLRALERFAAPHLLEGLLSAYGIGRERFKTVLFALGVSCVFVALARPQVGYEWQEVRARGVDLVIAMDVSKSMLARDIKPDRLERAKLAVIDLMGRIKGDRIGLVAFAGEAFLQCPLTLDYDAFRQSLEAVEPSLIPREGTDLGAAIAEASAAFDAGKNEKIIVLLTDGEDLEGRGLAQAKKAAAKGVVIYTVGVGTPQGDLIPVRDTKGQEDFLRDPTTGKLVTSKLEAATLSSVAEAAKGFYTPLGPTGEGLVRVYESGWNKLPQQELASRQQRKPIERFQWPLALAIFLLAWEPLIGTRKRFFLKLRRHAPLLLMATLFAFFGTPEANAQDTRLDFNRGTELYKSADYEQAAKAFTSALAGQTPDRQKDTFFNLGNTRFMQGLPLEQSDPKAALAHWENSLKDYDNALELSPQDTDAAHNRAIVERSIEQLKKREEEKEKQKQQQQNQQQQNQQQQSQEQQQQEQQQQNQQRQQQSQQEGSPQSQQGKQEEEQKPSEGKQAEQKSGEGEPQQEQQPQPQENQEGEQGKSGEQPQEKPESQKQEGASAEQEKEKESQAPQQDTSGQQQKDTQEQRAPDNRGVAEAKAPEQQPEPSPAEAAAAEKSEEKGEPQGEAYIEQPGVMSRQDAGFLLDSVKSHERKLPAAPVSFGTGENERTPPKPFKNW